MEHDNFIEFLSQEEVIQIQPNFRYEKIKLASGEFGPFDPLSRAKVPLWMALQLKKARKCIIIAPEWLNVEYLKQKLMDEQKDDYVLESIPFNYFEVAQQIINAAADDIKGVTQIRALVQDIWNKRTAKIRSRLLTLQPDTLMFKIKNITKMEVAYIREISCEAMNQNSKMRNNTPSE
jgi:GINS complex subunit 2